MPYVAAKRVSTFAKQRREMQLIVPIDTLSLSLSSCIPFLCKTNFFTVTVSSIYDVFTTEAHDHNLLHVVVVGGKRCRHRQAAAVGRRSAIVSIGRLSVCMMAKGATDKKCCTLFPSLFSYPRCITHSLNSLNSFSPPVHTHTHVCVYGEVESLQPLLIPIFDSSLSRPAPSCCLETA